LGWCLNLGGVERGNGLNKPRIERIQSVAYHI
jgi:hypothetical protein